LAITKLILSSDQLRVAETMVTLNREYEQLLGHLSQLQQFAVFQDNPSHMDFVKSCSVTLEEIRAWANVVLSDLLRDRAKLDWAFFQDEDRLQEEEEEKAQRKGQFEREWLERQEAPAAKEKPSKGDKA
jgi:hypothetical protein